MGRIINLAGERFGQLKIVGKSLFRDGKNTHWDYICDCGSTGHTNTTRLNAGQKSCGCHTHESIAYLNLSHGQTVGGVWGRTYRCYRAMLARCDYPSQVHYKDYGGRGISVCNRWRNGENGVSGFDCFRGDMGQQPDGLTIDRIDSDGNYEPNNCRWATPLVQARNRRTTKVDVDMMRSIKKKSAEGMPQNKLAKEFGVSRGSIRSAIAAQE